MALRTGRQPGTAWLMLTAGFAMDRFRVRNLTMATFAIVSFAALMLACLAVSADASWAVFVPAACLCLLVAIGVVVYASAGSMSAILACLVVLVFITDGAFRVRAKGDTGLDWQGVLKFAVWLGCGVIGAPHLPRLGRLLGEAGPALWLFYIYIAISSAFFSPAPAFSFGYAFALLCLFAFSFAVVRFLSEAQLLWAITLTLAVFLSAGLIVSVADPELGMSPETTPDGVIVRMTGIAGAANNLGSVCSIYLGAIFLLVWGRYCRPLPALIMASLGVVPLVASDTRTSLFAVVAGAAAVIFSRSIWSLAAVMFLAAAGVIGFMSLPVRLDAIGAYFARSGDATEALTLTGRTQIWEFAWSKFLESPIIGWGYNSTKVILAQHVGFANGLVVDTAHNLLLQNLLSVGLIGTLPLVGLFIKMLVDIGRGRPAPLSVFFLATVFVTGITDASALGTTPTLLTLMFMIATIWPLQAALRIGDPPVAEVSGRRYLGAHLGPPGPALERRT